MNNIQQVRHVPVLLITGYLGSGKTTLLNRILNNADGIRFAVIVNDIGEVNIDASLIARNGLIGMDGENADANRAADTVALQNGCICCTLQTDLAEQLSRLAANPAFDYIVIEASGICEPMPIAQTITMMPRMAPEYTENGIPQLDAIVSVVDARRLADEFDGGETLLPGNSTDDVAALVVQQIEFCDIVIINKISTVDARTAQRVRATVRALQPRARIIETDYCNVPIDDLLGTGAFVIQDTANSAGWLKHFENDEPEEEHHHRHDEHEHDEHGHEHDEHGHEHEHHHHDGEECDDPHCGCHHHHHGQHHDHAAHFGISTFVYRSRRPFDMNKFDFFVTRNWPKSVIRSKGMAYFSDDRDMAYLFEQAGSQKQLSKSGYWYATAPADELKEFLENDPQLRRDWDPEYGDRMNKLVFIGRNMDRHAITDALDDCLAD